MNRDNNFFELLNYRIENIEDARNTAQYQLDKIVTSKRWQYANKVADAANAVRTLGKNGQPSLSTDTDTTNEEQAETAPTASSKKRKTIKNVDIINYKFFDFDGNGFMNGGAERYVYDLALLLKKNNKKVRILQIAHVNFKKKYRGIEVVGVKVKHTDWWRFQEASEALSRQCGSADLVIASPLELACEINHCPSIGINHGLALDGPIDFSTYDNQGLLNRYRDVFRAIDKVDAGVCVDTNFMNWVQTFDYSSRQRLVYVPNYFDPEQFQPVKKSIGKKIIFTFPRRVSDYRGADITLAAFGNILSKYKDRVELRIIGQYHSDENREAVEKLIAQYPDNVSHREVAMDKMPEVYNESHVVLVPTKWSEGTSLSCIEAMATNNAVIATNVGGLPNLVIDGFNGMLISPTAEDLEQACLQLIENPAEIKRFADNAQQVVRTFTKSTWEDRWLAVIERVERQLAERS